MWHHSITFITWEWALLFFIIIESTLSSSGDHTSRVSPRTQIWPGSFFGTLPSTKSWINDRRRSGQRWHATTVAIKACFQASVAVKVLQGGWNALYHHEKTRLSLHSRERLISKLCSAVLYDVISSLSLLQSCCEMISGEDKGHRSQHAGGKEKKRETLIECGVVVGRSCGRKKKKKGLDFGEFFLAAGLTWGFRLGVSDSVKHPETIVS